MIRSDAPATTPDCRRQRTAPYGIDDALVVLAVVALSFATAFCAARAFTPMSDVMGRLAITIVTCASLVVVARSARLPAATTFACSLPAGVLAIGVIFDIPYRTMGLVPTAESIAWLHESMTDSFSGFLQAVPPVSATPGFVIPIAAVLWFCTSFGIFAAVDSHGPLHAAAAPLTLFATTSILLLGRYAIASTAAMALALMLLRLATAARSVSIRHSPRRSGSSALTRGIWVSGTAVILTSVAAALVVNAVVPLNVSGAIDLRAIGRPEPPRTVESPLVSVSALLRSQSTRRLFDVDASSAHYWRLTALDRFDGISWSATADYESVGDGRLAGEAPANAAADTVRQRFTLREAFSDWLPAAFAPTRIDLDESLRFDRDSTSIFLPTDDRPAAISYEVTSSVPDRDAVTADRFSSITTTPDDTTDTVHNLIDPSVAELARVITEGRSPFESALALERFFHTDRRFTYDTNVDYSRQGDPLVAFLNDGAGFCQQFATAFAAMARAVGIPARVAIGFVPGTATPIDESSTLFAVRANDGHAWPELYFDGLGWVPFEPTPGAQNPDASSYSTAPEPTGSGRDRDDLADSTTTTTAAPATTIADSAVAPTTTSDPSNPSDASDGDDASDGLDDRSAWRPGRGSALVALIALVAGATIVARVITVRRRARHLQAPDRPADRRIEASWDRVVADLSRIGIVAQRSETPLEFAERAHREVGEQEPLDTAIDLRRLGEIESRRRYAGTPPHPDDADRVAEIADQVHDLVWARLASDDKVRFLLDLR